MRDEEKCVNVNDPRVDSGPFSQRFIKHFHLRAINIHTTHETADSWTRKNILDFIRLQVPKNVEGVKWFVDLSIWEALNWSAQRHRTGMNYEDRNNVINAIPILLSDVEAYRRWSIIGAYDVHCLGVNCSYSCAALQTPMLKTFKIFKPLL